MATTKAKTRSTTKKASRDIQQEVTDQIIKAMEAGTVPWEKPWSGGGSGVPVSMSSGKAYRGINYVLLDMSAMIQGFTSPHWGTYKQITELGGQVNKGQKGTPIILYKPLTKETTNDKGETVEERSGVLMRSFTVFNASQCSDLPERYTKIEPDKRSEHERIEEAERVVQEYLDNNGPTLRHGGGQAFYMSSQDLVVVPDLANFRSPEAYYGTVLHELGHSTGHKTRLDREGVTDGAQFGSERYAAEELIAEMTSAMGCAALGIPNQEIEIEQRAAYIENWLTALKDDKTLVIKAAAAAQKAVDHIGITAALEKRLELEAAQAAELTVEPDAAESLSAEERAELVAEQEEILIYLAEGHAMKPGEQDAYDIRLAEIEASLAPIDPVIEVPEPTLEELEAALVLAQRVAINASASESIEDFAIQTNEIERCALRSTLSQTDPETPSNIEATTRLAELTEDYQVLIGKDDDPARKGALLEASQARVAGIQSEVELAQSALDAFQLSRPEPVADQAVEVSDELEPEVAVGYSMSL